MIFRYTLFLFIICNFMELSLSYEHHGRDKRFVVYPRGGSFKIVIGIGTPVKLGSKQSMAVGWNLQMQYSVPTNATQLETYPPLYTGKRSVDFNSQVTEKSDRAIFYSAFEDIFDNDGLNGRQCLLKSICENAMDPLDHEANGLYGKILHIILTPSYGDGEINTDLDPDYLEAEQAGEFGVTCQSLYSDCNLTGSLLDMFSILDSQLG